MKTVLFTNKLTGDILVVVFGPDGGSVSFAIPAVGSQSADNFPFLDLAIGAWTLQDSVLRHIGKIAPAEASHDIVQNVTAAVAAGTSPSVGPVPKYKVPN